MANRFPHEEGGIPLVSHTPYFVSGSTGSLELVGAHEHDSDLYLDFESKYRQPEDNPSLFQTMKEAVIKKATKFSLTRVLKKNFPTLGSLKHYKITQDLPNDIIAGLTAGIIMIPQCMAFAALATLPPIVGLYISLFASLTYFFVGSARQLSWGCVAVLSIMTGNILDKYESKVLGSEGAISGCENVMLSTTASLVTVLANRSGVSPNLGMMETTATAHTAFITHEPETVSVERKMEVAGSVTLISGIILAVLGKLGLGRITSFMSDYLVTSFTVGVSVHVVSSQLKTVLGLEFPRQSGLFKLIKHWEVLLRNIHHSNLATIIISVLSILAIYLVKRFINEKYKAKMRIPVPIELFVVIGVTVIMTFTGLSERFSVGVVEDIPVGVPKPRIPDLSLGADYITDGLMIIIVSYTQTVAMAKLIGLKYNYKVDPNQEMFACGMVSIVCSVFSGYISGASVSRSLVQDSAGGRTQVASLFAAGLVLLVIMVIGPYFYYLPKCVLAAIVLVNLRSVMLKFLTVPDLWRKSRVDALVWIVTCAAVVILDADIGLLVGVVASLLFVLIRTQITTVNVLGQLSVNEQNLVWRPKDLYFGAEEIGGIKVLQINSPLYFVNAEIVTNLVYKKAGVNPQKRKKILSKDVMGKSKTAKTEEICVTERICSSDGQVYNEDVDTRQQQEVEKGLTEDGSIRTDLELTRNSPPQRCNSSSDDIPFHSLVLDLSGVTFIDLMGVDSLQFLIAQYEQVGIVVFISNVHEKLATIFQKTDFVKKHSSCIFLTVETAVAQALLKNN